LWASDLRIQLQLYTYFYLVWPYNMVIWHYIVLFLEPGTGRVSIKEVPANIHVPKATWNIAYVRQYQKQAWAQN
jgi:hypothetical protein